VAYSTKTRVAAYRLFPTTESTCLAANNFGSGRRNRTAVLFTPHSLRLFLSSSGGGLFSETSVTRKSHGRFRLFDQLQQCNRLQPLFIALPVPESATRNPLSSQGRNLSTCSVNSRHAANDSKGDVTSARRTTPPVQVRFAQVLMVNFLFSQIRVQFVMFGMCFERLQEARSRTSILAKLIFSS